MRYRLNSNIKKGFQLMSSALEIHNKDLDDAKENGLTISQLLIGGDFLAAN
ncbi:MAG: hypothetical protein Ct9H300mP28_04010 [Pseudomonadota bacterium]|nr:MAG: hypothetical protein Ct9H300mP28_04010 [Pseudomonadota bacterium]